VDELLAMVELSPAATRDRRSADLSGGEQQRVGVARALAASPRLMLLDEPFGALDPLTRDHLQAGFMRIRRQLGLTAIFVTHDMAEALLLGDRIAVMKSGRLVQIGTPRDLLRAPADDYVRGLVDTPLRQARIIDGLLQ
jgi:osmoprotectant transport system ATP-binding protein